MLRVTAVTQRTDNGRV